MNELKDCYDLVTANLRFPTLNTICSKIYAMLNVSGILVISGFRNEEKESLLKNYQDKGFELLASDSEGGWESAVFKK